MRDKFTDQDLERACVERQMTTRKYTRHELVRFFTGMAVISFLLHWIWEMLQMPAYQEIAGRPLLAFEPLCVE